MPEPSRVDKASKNGKLSVAENLQLAVTCFGAITILLTSFISYPFIGSPKKHPVLFRHCIYAVFRYITKRLTPRQFRSISHTTEETYDAFLTKERLNPNKVLIDEDGTKAYWLGDPAAAKVLLYFHGGGYYSHANIDVHAYCWNLSKQSDGKLSALVLDYGEILCFLNQGEKSACLESLAELHSPDLAPENPYPRQLAQAVKAIQYLMSIGKLPSDIIAGGDSAGGHLALSLLSHLTHPHPSETVPGITLQSPLLGFILISPGVSLEGRDAPLLSLTRDLVDASATVSWIAAYRGNSPNDPYNSPLDNDSQWWRGSKAQNILVVGGEDEFLATTIMELAKKIESVHGGTEIFLAPGEEHDAVFVDSMLGYKEKPQSAIVIANFVKKLIN